MLFFLTYNFLVFMQLLFQQRVLVHAY
jgi:hypothetical protein